MDKKIKAINLFNINNIGYRDLKINEVISINSYYGLINRTIYAEALELIRVHY